VFRHFVLQIGALQPAPPHPEAHSQCFPVAWDGHLQVLGAMQVPVLRQGDVLVGRIQQMHNGR
jgi:hypothetical protein